MNFVSRLVRSRHTSSLNDEWLICVDNYVAEVLARSLKVPGALSETDVATVCPFPPILPLSYTYPIHVILSGIAHYEVSRARIFGLFHRHMRMKLWTPLWIY